jgi:hypothetical protein
MKKLIFIFFSIFILKTSLTAQTRTVMYENDTIKIIHDFYENIPMKGIYLYPSTSIYYVSEKEKTDTFGFAFSRPLGKAYFQNGLFSFLHLEMDGRGTLRYSLIEKNEKKWKLLAHYGGRAPNSKSEYDLEQIDLLYLREKVINGYDQEENQYNEIRLDVQKSMICIHKLNNNGTRVENDSVTHYYPFPKYHH